MLSSDSFEVGSKDPEWILRFFDNRSGKVAKALGET